jgi:hypothetical protein
MVEPGPGRIALVLVSATSVIGLFVALSRWATGQSAVVDAILAAPAGVVSMLLIGSMGEWLVHRYAMHRGRRFPLFRLATELHHRAHHWVHFTPDRYVHAGPIEYPSVSGKGTAALCRTRLSRILTVAGHAGFYSLFGGPILWASWAATNDVWFLFAATLTTTVLIFLFIRVHDAVHYPGASRLERFRWFWFLDRHHYIHHIDNRANTNFLLPLGDLLMGTLRLDLTAAELQRWSSYEAARKSLFDPRSGD